MNYAQFHFELKQIGAGAGMIGVLLSRLGASKVRIETFFSLFIVVTQLNWDVDARFRKFMCMPKECKTFKYKSRIFFWDRF